MTAEFNRLIANVCQFGTVVEVKSSEGLLLARVKIDERVTDFFPVVGKSNSFKKHFIPISVDEQVVVFCPFGEANIGIIIPSIFNKSSKEPTGSSENREVIEYADGTVIYYDTSSKELNINSVGDIKITCAGNINIDCNKNVEIVCNKATLTAPAVDVTGETKINGSLLVTGAITGAGGIAISGGSGATFKGNINSSGNISTTGTISDSRGSLTSHTHNSIGRD